MNGEQPGKVGEAGYSTTGESAAGCVLVRIDQKRTQESVIPHSIAIARALDRPLLMFALINPDESLTGPADPVEWDLRRREAQLHLNRITQEFHSADLCIETRVLEQFLPEEFGLSEGGQRAILAFSREASELPWLSDGPGRRFLERLCPSVLMVPVNLPLKRQVIYSRIIVPLDGSSRAESALPAALTLARCHDAELLLVHAAAEPDFLVRGPLEAEALELRREVQTRNTRVAKTYLDNLCARLQSAELNVDTRLLVGGDARRKLVWMANNEAADLIVMASHGSGDFGDVRSGSVASFILEHAAQPVLMVSRSSMPDAEHLWTDSALKGARRSGESAVSA